MLEVLCKNPTIYNFLRSYPKDRWRRCIEAAVVCGILTLQSKHGPNPNFEVLRSYFYEEKNNLISQKIQLMRADLDQLNHAFGRIDRTSELEQVSTPKFNLARDSNFKYDQPSFEQVNPVINSTPRSMRSQEISDLKRLPRYLQNIESKIKQDVKKDVHKYFHQISLSNQVSLGFTHPPNRSSNNDMQEFTESDRSSLRSLKPSSQGLIAESTQIFKQREYQSRNHRPQSMSAGS